MLIKILKFLQLQSSLCWHETCAGTSRINLKVNLSKVHAFTDNFLVCKNVVISQNFAPIFNDCNILIKGQTYKPFEFLKILRATKDGARGSGVIEENNEFLKVAYTTLKFEQSLVSTGESKKGFIKA